MEYQLKSIIEELKIGNENRQNLSTLERILWLTLPENVTERYELFLRVADLQGYVGGFYTTFELVLKCKKYLTVVLFSFLNNEVLELI